jgi:hypothetical protein
LQRFSAERSRFKDGQRLVKKFTRAITKALEGKQDDFRAVDEAHNELCVAYHLLQSTDPRYVSVAYEPPLVHCAESIDFMADEGTGATVFIDVKTIRPKDSDRWDQYERAQQEKWFPDTADVLLQREWLGDELWHNLFASRSRMLEHTLALERKIRESRLASQEKTRIVLMLCGYGFKWHEDELEDFVCFYFTGRHHPIDPLGKAEARHITTKNITLSRSISLFACMKRSPWLIDYEDIYYHYL